jgi:hypothetical protein
MKLAAQFAQLRLRGCAAPFQLRQCLAYFLLFQRDLLILITASTEVDTHALDLRFRFRDETRKLFVLRLEMRAPHFGVGEAHRLFDVMSECRLGCTDVAGLEHAPDRALVIQDSVIDKIARIEQQTCGIAEALKGAKRREYALLDEPIDLCELRGLQPLLGGLLHRNRSGPQRRYPCRRSRYRDFVGVRFILRVNFRLDETDRIVRFLAQKRWCIVEQAPSSAQQAFHDGSLADPC